MGQYTSCELNSGDKKMSLRVIDVDLLLGRLVSSGAATGTPEGDQGIAAGEKQVLTFKVKKVDVGYIGEIGESPSSS